MKKMMILACLIFSITAITAVAADLAAIQGTSNSDMIAQLTNMDADSWVDYLNTVINSGDEALIKRVLTNAQTALNRMDDEAARVVAAAINKDVPMVVLKRRLTGRYTLSYVPTVMADDPTIKLKLQQVSSGASKN